MTYVAKAFPVNRPYFVLATLADFEEKVPDLNARAEVADAFSDGTRLLRSHEIPTRLRLDTPIKRVRDIFVSHSGVLIVSRALHDLLEEVDPGLHQFSPIAIELLPHAGEHFLLNVHHQQDSIIDEMSNVRRNAGMPDNRDVMYINFLPGGGVDVTVDVSQLGKANLWREKRYPGSMLVSNPLRDETRRRGLKFFTLWKVAETRGE
jgi:hypothetical protein